MIFPLGIFTLVPPTPLKTDALGKRINKLAHLHPLYMKVPVRGAKSARRKQSYNTVLYCVLYREWSA